MSITKKIVLTLLCILSIVLGTGYFLGLAYFQTHFKIGTTIEITITQKIWKNLKLS